jgi:hypothetical protein
MTAPLQERRSFSKVHFVTLSLLFCLLLLSMTAIGISNHLRFVRPPFQRSFCGALTTMFACWYWVCGQNLRSVRSRSIWMLLLPSALVFLLFGNRLPFIDLRFEGVLVGLCIEDVVGMLAVIALLSQASAWGQRPVVCLSNAIQSRSELWIQASWTLMFLVGSLYFLTRRVAFENATQLIVESLWKCVLSLVAVSLIRSLFRKPFPRELWGTSAVFCILLATASAFYFWNVNLIFEYKTKFIAMQILGGIPSLLFVLFLSICVGIMLRRESSVLQTKALKEDVFDAISANHRPHWIAVLSLAGAVFSCALVEQLKSQLAFCKVSEPLPPEWILFTVLHWAVMVGLITQFSILLAISSFTWVQRFTYLGAAIALLSIPFGVALADVPLAKYLPSIFLTQFASNSIVAVFAFSSTWVFLIGTAGQIDDSPSSNSQVLNRKSDPHPMFALALGLSPFLYLWLPHESNRYFGIALNAVYAQTNETTSYGWYIPQSTDFFSIIILVTVLIPTGIIFLRLAIAQRNKLGFYSIVLLVLFAMIISTLSFTVQSNFGMKRILRHPSESFISFSSVAISTAIVAIANFLTGRALSREKQNGPMRSGTSHFVS